MRTETQPEGRAIQSGIVLLTDRALRFPAGTTVHASLLFGGVAAHGPGRRPASAEDLGVAGRILTETSLHAFRLPGGFLTVLPPERSAEPYEGTNVLYGRLRAALPTLEPRDLVIGGGTMYEHDRGVADATLRALAQAIAVCWNLCIGVPSRTTEGGLS